MTRQRIQIEVARPAADVTALLASRPTGWLRGFMQLATASSGSRSSALPLTPHWFRLGKPTDVSPGVLTVPFLWYPHVGATVFSRFGGQFVLTAENGSTKLAVEGETDGGGDERNRRVLTTLVRSIAAALSEPSDHHE